MLRGGHAAREAGGAHGDPPAAEHDAPHEGRAGRVVGGGDHEDVVVAVAAEGVGQRREVGDLEVGSERGAERRGGKREVAKREIGWYEMWKGEI